MDQNLNTHFLTFNKATCAYEGKTSPKTFAPGNYRFLILEDYEQVLTVEKKLAPFASVGQDGQILLLWRDPENEPGHTVKTICIGLRCACSKGKHDCNTTK